MHTARSECESSDCVRASLKYRRANNNSHALCTVQTIPEIRCICRLPFITASLFLPPDFLLQRESDCCPIFVFTVSMQHALVTAGITEALAIMTANLHNNAACQLFKSSSKGCSHAL